MKFPLINKKILILILILIFTITYVTEKSLNNQSVFSSNEDISYLIKTSKPIDSPGSYIKTTTPKPFAKNIDYSSPIQIIFNTDMDSKTLNSTNILILEGQHGDRFCSDMFNFNYEAKSRTLNIVFKDAKSSFPPQDGITVIVTTKVHTITHKPIKHNYIFGYSIK